jgi:ANTAR domain
MGRAVRFLESSASSGKMTTNGTIPDDQPAKSVEDQLADCEKLVENLNISRVHRGTIDQAIGILMAPGGRTSADVMAILVQASQRENRKLRDIAADLVRERSTPVMAKADDAEVPQSGQSPD